MRKSFLIIVLIVAAYSLKAQQQSPLFFHNHLEYMSYRMEHPEMAPLKATETFRHHYTQKLDSIIGSDNFDWTRWKNVYAYVGNANAPDSMMIVETNYEWHDQAWVPAYLSEISEDSMVYYQWNEEGWEPYSRIKYQFTECNGNRLVESYTNERYDSVWSDYLYYTYEYDENCNLLLIMIYDRKDASGEWKAGGKYNYTYDDQGALMCRVYSTIRNGNWNETQKDTLMYDDQHQCTSLLSKRKGGWGPFANQWMVDYRYDFEYENGQLQAEMYYLGGWFGDEMTLDSKSEYFFDANGNEERKTASVFNEIDWIERDVYENRFDLSVRADEVLGLASVWESTLGKGMGYVLDMETPLNNKWLSCAIISTNLDTDFTLYCSGFAGIEEHHGDGPKVCSEEGLLMVENVEPHDVTVYDLLGRVVASQKNVVRCEFQLNAGLYVVGNGIGFVKAVVR